MKLSVFLALQSVCLLASAEPLQTPAHVPASTTPSIPGPTSAPGFSQSWTTSIVKRADAATDDNTAAETTGDDTATNTGETTAETTAESASETSSETSSTSSETTSSDTSTTSSTSSTSTTSSSTSSSSSATATSTSTTDPATAHRNHVGNIAAIAVCSVIGGVAFIVFTGLALRKRIIERRMAEKKALLAAGSSSFSMVPAPGSATASDVKLDRLSMMFADQPAPQAVGGATVSTTPMVMPQQGQQMQQTRQQEQPMHQGQPMQVQYPRPMSQHLPNQV